MSLTTSPYEAVGSPSPNGSHLEPPPEPGMGSPLAQGSGPRIQRRYVWVDLPPDAYPGFRVRVWANFPGDIQRELNSASETRKMRALAQIVVEHNGWIDYEGNEYPPADDIGERCEAEHTEGEECPGVIRPGFWDRIPPELAQVALTVAMLQVGKLSTSLQQPRRGR